MGKRWLRATLAMGQLPQSRRQVTWACIREVVMRVIIGEHQERFPEVLCNCPSRLELRGNIGLGAQWG